ncbi:hypothetical protein MHB71_20055 [Paenibacillus sp. FSL H7-0940]|uniref:spermidine synthase n=1 Tax=Paenibacillus sp. FSL H7-0940 TaxID=2921443 RepID=UPI0030ED45D4
MQEKHLKRGLYGDRHLILITMESVLAHDRIFVGNQPDDFGIASVLAPGKRVLMLGLGYGGSIRSLLAGIENIELHIIDNDPNIIKSCSSLFQDVFPDIHNRVHYIQGDASGFSEIIEGKFDAICIDTYTNDGYPDFIFGDTFWNQVKETLSPGGISIVNAMGLPTHLYPLQGDTPQARVLHQMRTQMNYVYSMPYRRSLTFICSNEEPQAKEVELQYELKKFDELIINMFPMRWNMARRVNIGMTPSKYTNHVSGLQEDIDKEMNARWPDFIKILNRGLVACGYTKIEAKDLKALLFDSVRSSILTEWLLNNDYIEEAAFIPNFVGTLSYTEDAQHMRWFHKWILNHGERLNRLHKEWFINTALWQVMASITNPFAHNEHLFNEADELIKKLTLYNDKLKV